ncbi:cell wall protein [Canna indica]|uniref:Cell wall protein n=1 Tax=Canna indica TaxID=4628 RepID=A0AAQ3Q269_9LILI|nr:cell wall protein [Canna indica]
MATVSPPLPLVLSLLGLLCFAQVLAAAAARTAPVSSGEKAAPEADKKEPECDSHEGTVLIPGIGRYMIGSHEKPALRGLDHSGPAAAHGQYLPGGDDTFVPNPGFEVPNPFTGVIPP